MGCNKMKQEDRRKLWEWCGFSPNFYDDILSHKQEIYDWQYPKEVDQYKHSEVALPQLTLDDLFKYAVPKLGFEVIDFILLDDNSWVCRLYRVGTSDVTCKATARDPAEALASAILKVIDNE